MQQVKKVAITTAGVLVAIFILRQVGATKALVDKALVG